ncbi:hypothetical protein EGT07_15765 [Herbaspirillum sp. HC18]|nr:hypothetical protein EGT07_15765 [Herbaspirillum sp. HC18]
MRVEPARTDGSNLTARSATNKQRNTHAPKCSPRPAYAHRSSCAFRPSSAAANRRKRRAIRAANIANDLKQCPKPIQLRMVWHLWHCDEDYGTRIAQAADINLGKALDLQPLSGKPAPNRKRTSPTYTSGKKEEAAPAK